MDQYLSTRNLSVGYNGKALIRDIALDIRRGEIVTLIGPNGSGKSTILKSLTRQLKLIGGTVCMDGRDAAGITRKELATRMAVVLTERLRPELMTCRDIVATGRYPYTGRLGLLSPDDEAKVSRAMRLLRVTELANRNFDAISDGQRQRVLLARAVCQEPEIIVLDEPTSYLDIRHKLELLTILRDMAKESNITVVMSLHEIDLAQKISDRIICVKGDHIALMGSPEDIFVNDAVSRLYEIPDDAYDPLFGSVELPNIEGEPRVFIICGNGTGTRLFRRAQKLRIPFAAGILYENDIDHRIALRLAAETVSALPFEDISSEAIQRAMELIDMCEYTVNARPPIGKHNSALRQLIEYASSLGKLKETIDP